MMLLCVCVQGVRVVTGGRNGQVDKWQGKKNQNARFPRSLSLQRRPPAGPKPACFPISLHLTPVHLRNRTPAARQPCTYKSILFSPSANYSSSSKSSSRNQSSCASTSSSASSPSSRRRRRLSSHHTIPSLHHPHAPAPSRPCRPPPRPRTPIRASPRTVRTRIDAPPPPQPRHRHHGDHPHHPPHHQQHSVSALRPHRP